MKRTLLILLALMALPTWAESTVVIGGITWYTNYDQAMQVAQKRGVPLWLHFGENPG